MTFVICGPSECLIYRVKLGRCTYTVQLFGEEHVEQTYDPCENVNGMHVIPYIDRILSTLDNSHLFIEAVYDHTYKNKFKHEDQANYDSTKSVLYNVVNFFTKHKRAFRRERGLVHYADIRPSSILLRNRKWGANKFLIRSTLSELVDTMFELFVYSDNFFDTLSRADEQIKWEENTTLFKHVRRYNSKVVHIVRKQLLKLKPDIQKKMLGFVAHLKEHWKVHGNVHFGYDDMDEDERRCFISNIMGGVFVDLYMIARMLRNDEEGSTHKQILGMFGSAHLAETHLQFCEYMKKDVEVLYQSNTLQNLNVYNVSNRENRIHINTDLVNQLNTSGSNNNSIIYKSYREAKQHGIGTQYVRGGKVCTIRK